MIIDRLDYLLTENPPESASQPRRLQQYNAEALEDLAAQIKAMMTTANAFHDKVIWLTESVKDKHESWVKPSKWVWGGLVVGGCAAVCLVPAWPLYAWVGASSSWTYAALCVGAAGGAGSTGWGRWRYNQESKATDLRKKVNDSCRGIRRDLKKLFDAIAVCYYEAVLRSQFDQLSEDERNKYRNRFRIDVREIKDPDYVHGLVEHIKEGLKASKEDFMEVLALFRDHEGLAKMAE